MDIIQFNMKGDIEHYQRMIVVLVETGRVMGEIDKIIL